MAIRLDVIAHLRNFVGPVSDALVFTMLRGGPMRRGNFNPLVKWSKVVAGIGAPNLRFHELRHTGNILAAPGAGLRDLMTRMGHDSPRARWLEAVARCHPLLLCDRSGPPVGCFGRLGHHTHYLGFE